MNIQSIQLVKDVKHGQNKGGLGKGVVREGTRRQIVWWHAPA